MPQPGVQVHIAQPATFPNHFKEEEGRLVPPAPPWALAEPERV